MAIDQKTFPDRYFAAEWDEQEALARELFAEDTDAAAHTLLHVLRSMGKHGSPYFAARHLELGAEEADVDAAGPIANALFDSLTDLASDTGSAESAIGLAAQIAPLRFREIARTSLSLEQGTPAAIPTLMRIARCDEAVLPRKECLALAARSRVSEDQGEHAGWVLHALAPSASEADMKKLWAYAGAEPYRLGAGARSAILKHHGLFAWDELVNELGSAVEDIRAEPECIRDAWLVAAAKCQIANGGTEQFWINGGYETWRETVDAATRLGSSNLAKLVTTTASLFPDQTPPSTQDELFDQLDHLDDFLDETGQDEAEEDLVVELELLLVKHMVAHAEFFRAMKVD